MAIKHYYIALLSVALITSCAGNPYLDLTKPHHTESGFKNIDYEDNKGFFAFMKWRWEKLFKDTPDADGYQFELINTDHELLKNNSKPSLTWIGHATFLIQFAQLNILTDPHFSERASPVSWAGPRRVVQAALKIDELPEIDAVVISHDHYDSLDTASIIELSKHNRSRELTFIVPLGFRSWFDDLDLKSVQVIELDWAEYYNIGDVRFTAEPSQHWSKRTLFDAYKRLWASFVIESDGKRIFFAGDTGYAEHFKTLGEKYGQFDLALLPIGAYEPRWFMKSYHVNPEESVQIHLDINSQHSVAMHWGTFILADEALDAPPVKLTEALRKHQLSESAFSVYRHGETRYLDYLITDNN